MRLIPFDECAHNLSDCVQGLDFDYCGSQGSILKDFKRFVIQGSLIEVGEGHTRMLLKGNVKNVHF